MPTENKLPVVSVKNQAGSWVQPTAAGTTAAINAFAAELADVRTSTVDPQSSAKDAYPISSLTFLLVPKQGKDPKKTGTLKQFIARVGTQGQTQAQNMAYAPISASLQQQDESLLSQVGEPHHLPRPNSAAQAGHHNRHDNVADCMRCFRSSALEKLRYGK